MGWCPKCKEYSACGCKSCKKHDSEVKRGKFVDGEFIECPHCKEVSFCDSWLDEEYRQRNHSKVEKK